MAERNDADILSQILGETHGIRTDQRLGTEISDASLAYLRDIDKSLKTILRGGTGMSASNAANGMPGTSHSGYFSGNNSSGGSGDYFRNQQSTRKGGNRGGFLDGFEQSLMEAALGKDFKDKVKVVVGNFADQLGVNIQDIPNALGRELGNQILNAAKRTELGKQMATTIGSLKQRGGNWLKNKYNEGVDSYVRRSGGMARGQTAARAEDLFRTRRTGSDSGGSTQPGVKGNFKPGASASQMGAMHIKSIDVGFVKIHNLAILRTASAAEAKGIQQKSKERAQKQIEIERAQRSASDAQDSTRPDVTGGPDSLKNDSQSKAQDVIKDEFTDKLLGSVNRLKQQGKDKGREALDKLLSQKNGILGKLISKNGVLGRLIRPTGVLGQFVTKGKGIITKLLGAGAGTLGSGTMSGAAISGMLAPLGAAFGALLIAVSAVTVAMKVFGPILKANSDYLKAMGKAANRETEQRKKNLELSKQRAVSDMQVMMETPFKILEAAAQKAYDVWDANLRMINGTQGYTKSDLQSLMGTYSERLKSEGLSSVIASTDVTANLAKVLDSGLSGKAAEEFALIATKLGAAIPNQDFFGYAATYSSLAANAIRQGESEAKAIAYANEQMELFASNILFASRQISGGFSTGLKNAQQLFNQSVHIAQASKNGDPSQIAGVMTSVAAITGAIAPDLAQSMTDAIYKSALGGNTSDLTALRSLAGVSASNTEFLKQLSNNPQKVFSDLFSGLADMQNMSSNAWMEVAEQVSQTFGLTQDTFSRIDFNYLAEAISNMSVNNASLEENMKLLKQGETTTSTEQLKIAEINQKLIDEGLSYVLDNEAARSIQENMWAEQRQREILEATFAVDLQGAGLDYLESIRGFVEKIMNFVNPLAWFKKVNNLVSTYAEGAGQKSDIRQMLELGRVGKGNVKSMYQLTTHNANLNLMPKLVDLMGGVSGYGIASNSRKLYNSLASPLYANNTGIGLGSMLAGGAQSIYGGLFQGNTTSNYQWGTLGKTIANALSQGTSSGKPSIGLSNLVSTASASSIAQTSANGNIDKMIEELADKIKADKSLTYESWVQSAKSYGISDFSAAAAAGGHSEVQLRDFFAQREAEEGMGMQAQRDEKEHQFWDRLAFNGDSLWQMTMDDNLVKQEIRDQLVTYHENYINTSAITNDSLSMIHSELLGHHQLLREFIHDGNGVRIEIRDAQKLHYDAYTARMVEWDTIIKNIDTTADIHYRNYDSLTKTTHQKLDIMTSLMTDSRSGYLASINNKLEKFHQDWVAFYIQQSWDEFSDVQNTDKIRLEQQQGDREAIYDLADILGDNFADLRNPTMQTNALLAEMLKVLVAIMNQNNNKIDGLSLYDSLAGMSLGLTKTTTS